MNTNETTLSDDNWRLQLHDVLWNNFSTLCEKELTVNTEIELIDIIQSHLADGISTINIIFLQKVADLFFFYTLSEVFWYYTITHQNTILDAFPSFDPFTICDVALYEYLDQDHILQIAEKRPEQFLFAAKKFADDYVQSEKLSSIINVIAESRIEFWKKICNFEIL